MVLEVEINEEGNWNKETLLYRQAYDLQLGKEMPSQIRELGPNRKDPLLSGTVKQKRGI